MTGIHSLLAVAEAYASACAIPLKTVSKRALQDSSRLDELRAGECDIGVKRLQRTLAWFSDNWPAAAKWPVDVVRPEGCAAVRPIPDATLPQITSAHT